MFEPLNVADSMIISVVSSVISEFAPPITPAIATGFLWSAMRSISSVNFLSLPSRVVIFSPFFASLTMIPPSMCRRSNA